MVTPKCLAKFLECYLYITELELTTVFGLPFRTLNASFYFLFYKCLLSIFSRVVKL